MFLLPQRALPPRVDTLARANFPSRFNAGSGFSFPFLHRDAHVRQNPRHDFVQTLHVSASCSPTGAPTNEQRQPDFQANTVRGA